MKTERIVRGMVKALMFLPLVALVIALVSFLFMNLWNWLMPALFGLRIITFWQALGLLILCKILFGGFRGRYGRGGHWRWRPGMRSHWEHMSPEEREKFRQGLRDLCDSFVGRTAAPKGEAEPKSPTA